jgi:hypothetical protein
MAKIRIAIVAAIFAGFSLGIATSSHAQYAPPSYSSYSYDQSPLANENKRYVGENGGG